MKLLPLFAFQEIIIVDRIEDNVAVVEWHNERLSIIPLDNFATTPQEGDAYIFQAHRFGQATCTLRNNDPIVIQCEERSQSHQQSALQT